MNAASDGAAGLDDIGRGLSPTAARRRLGALMRELRDRAGLTLEQAGEVLQRSSATVSRLETGKVKPRQLEISVLLDHYARQGNGAVTDAEQERALLLATESRREAWFAPFRDVLAGSMVSEHARRYMEFETDAARIESFEPDLVSGLLQSPRYIRAIARTYFPDSSEEQRERFTQFRLQRQEVLRRKTAPLRFHVVLGEWVLRRTLGGPETMLEQLGALADHVRKGTPNITIQVAPATLISRAVIGGPFVVMSFADAKDNDFVYLEGRAGADYQHGEAQLAHYRSMFVELTASALDRDGTLAVIEEAIKTHQ